MPLDSTNSHNQVAEFPLDPIYLSLMGLGCGFEVLLGDNMFKRYYGNWVDLRECSPREVDFHFGGGMGVNYWESMDKIKDRVRNELKRAHCDGTPCVLFKHGKSTSRRRCVFGNCAGGSRRRPDRCENLLNSDRVFSAHSVLCPARSVTSLHNHACPYFPFAQIFE